MRIALSALIIAATLVLTLASMEHSTWWPGWHSTPGIWGAVFNLPGFAIAAGLHFSHDERRNEYLVYSVMFAVNWLFYWGLIHGLLSVKWKVFR